MLLHGKSYFKLNRALWLAETLGHYFPVIDRITGCQKSFQIMFFFKTCSQTSFEIQNSAISIAIVLVQMSKVLLLVCFGVFCSKARDDLACPVKTSVWYFLVMTALNKKLFALTKKVNNRCYITENLSFKKYLLTI